MATRTDTVPRFDVLEPSELDDPYPSYARLRAAGPLCKMVGGVWGITRYAEVADLLRDPRLGVQFPEEYHRVAIGDGPLSDFSRNIVLANDAPVHTRLRRLLGNVFSPARVRALEVHIGSLVDELLAPHLEAGRVDVAHLAHALAVRVACELIGIPETAADDVASRAEALMRVFSPFNLDDDHRREAETSLLWLQACIGDLLDSGTIPQDTVLARLRHAPADGEDSLSRAELIDNAVFLCFSGLETTVNLLGSGLSSLSGSPDQWELLLADSALIPSAVEEMLRYDAPSQVATRFVTEPIEIDGRTLRRGRVVLLLLGSANRDERQFSDPNRFDVTRAPNPHVSFGGGVHRCLGQALARLDTSIVLNRLRTAAVGLEPAGPVVRDVSTHARIFTSVPIELTT